MENSPLVICVNYRNSLQRHAQAYEGKENCDGYSSDLHAEEIVNETYPTVFDFAIDVSELLGNEFILHGKIAGQNYE